ncbi:dipeptidyl peptidase III [Aspergillus steynii IBT 23096]|uniref:Dipeptidyl peptidase III n=1 Tax=Aspergillus steynii IBT 23096 TaxID=1392250 RepID=A0A2I2GPL9_9EURO|nr:dipeptidyl peptidase III [Aspergillus steynii IBT 23096]PLB54821.1 dipeptidyl peptidase III [Aspergillus steynii IBT 23096]
MSPEATYQLAIQDLWDGLSQQEKLFAHHLSRAAWHGSRIILRQTSPEGPGILDFILELHKACQGQWSRFVESFGISDQELVDFLDYAGMFLSKLNNFWGEGDRKVVPNLSVDSLRSMASISQAATNALDKVIEPMISATPSVLGLSDSAYYLGDAKFTSDEIADVSRVMEEHAVEPENTRIRKSVNGDKTVYDILQASVKTNAEMKDHLKGSDIPMEHLQLSSEDGVEKGNDVIRLERGDHSEEMSRICDSVTKAMRFSSNDTQARYIQDYIESFTTGSLQAYRSCMKRWVEDYNPRVESIFGFVEPYRDPYGVRCEWRGVVSIADPQETAKLTALVNSSTKLIRTLPWAVPDVNDGKGPFEKSEFQAPHFSIVHALAFGCSNVWEASKVPNYNDIRETHGFKNIVYANRMSANADPNREFYWVHPSEAKEFKAVNHIIRFIATSIHELLGHGTGKLLAETSPGVYNFDRASPPTNSLTGKPTSVFEKLAGTVEECRVMLVSYYLSEDRDVLSMYGYDEHSDIKADDLIYQTYLHIGVEGLRALQAFNVETQSWGSAHANANYAIFKHLMLHANGLLSVDCNQMAGTVFVRVDRSKIASHGKACIGNMLHRIHVWRCTANVTQCRQFYEPLSAVDGEYEVWRQIVASKPEPPWKFVQANTILRDDGKVELKVYEASNEGIIQSFAERNL